MAPSEEDSPDLRAPASQKCHAYCHETANEIGLHSVAHARECEGCGQDESSSYSRIGSWARGCEQLFRYTHSLSNHPLHYPRKL